MPPSSMVPSPCRSTPSLPDELCEPYTPWDWHQQRSHERVRAMSHKAAIDIDRCVSNCVCVCVSGCICIAHTRNQVATSFLGHRAHTRKCHQTLTHSKISTIVIQRSVNHNTPASTEPAAAAATTTRDNAHQVPSNSNSSNQREREGKRMKHMSLTTATSIPLSGHVVFLHFPFLPLLFLPTSSSRSYHHQPSPSSCCWLLAAWLVRLCRPLLVLLLVPS
jgi:hypothetical protein